MARIQEREKAIQLRKEGGSYSQIKKALRVSKGTLSIWLKDYPLPEHRLRELRDHNEQRIENFRETMRKKRNARLSLVYREQKKKILPLGKRDLLMAGLFLYWGEGTKHSMNTLVLANTDPAMIRLYTKWLMKSLGIPKEKIKVKLQLYKDMDVQAESKYWSIITTIPLIQFRNPQIKTSHSTRINHKGRFGHGTCDVEVNNVLLGERVAMSIQLIRDSMRV
ncbi:MAG: helix-turn-helix domain-containing protein [bacterium]|nr:helix-turn-helix domain-containing protein [bacterium]